MSKPVALTAVLLAAWCPAAWCLAAPPGPATAAAPPGSATAAATVTREQLEKAVAKLAANAALWVEDKSIPAKERADLSGLKFDKSSAPVVTAVLGGIKRDAEGLYVTARLLERLQTCDLDTISAIIAEVRRIELHAKGMYRSFPPVSKGAAGSVAMPKYSPRLSAEDIMAHMGTVEAQREAKRQRELSIAKQNEAVWNIEQAAYRLIAIGGDEGDDMKALKAMAVGERAGDAIFATILDAYLAAAPKMEPARAANLYQVLRPHALRLRTQGKKKYTCKGKSNLRFDATSEMAVIEDSAGPRILALINKLAEVSKDKSLEKVSALTQK